MADPHNPDRYGEVWPQHRLDAYLEVCQAIKSLVVFSGGWAWHFLSPAGHVEYKHAHDHKDVDLMVPPRTVASTLDVLQGLGFEKVTTKYDRLTSKEDFRRYEKVVTLHRHGDQPWGPDQADCLFCDLCEETSFRITIDFFVKDVPIVQCPGGWLVVRPDELLGYYSTIHSSTSCWAVLAATQLLANGATPEALVGDPRLTACAELDCWFCRKCHWSGQFPIKAGRLTFCGGCQKYTATNLGKPPFKPQAQQMAEAVKYMKEAFPK